MRNASARSPAELLPVRVENTELDRPRICSFMRVEAITCVSSDPGVGMGTNWETAVQFVAHLVHKLSQTFRAKQTGSVCVQV